MNRNRNPAESLATVPPAYPRPYRENPPLTRLESTILRVVAGFTWITIGPVCLGVFFVDSPDARERARVALAELRRRRMVESTGSRYRCTPAGRICAAEPIRAKK